MLSRLSRQQQSNTIGPRSISQQKLTLSRSSISCPEPIHERNSHRHENHDPFAEPHARDQGERKNHSECCNKITRGKPVGGYVGTLTAQHWERRTYKYVYKQTSNGRDDYIPFKIA